jgi:hypothetical protein
MVFPDDVILGVKHRYEGIWMYLTDERQKRIWAATEARELGHGGLKVLSDITGLTDATITKGMKELSHPEDVDLTRIRKPGGGRKPVTEKYPGIEKEVEAIVGGSTFGNPENPLSYTTKSLRTIQLLLSDKGYEIGHDTVGRLLEELGYSLQLNQKMLQVNEPHPDRNTQFEYINAKSRQFLDCGDPVISVDTKKKELVGNFKNNGRTYNLEKHPTKVLDHDFPLEELGKVAPFGVYDIGRNLGFVNLGVSGDTGAFAVESISRWWLTVGKNTYPDAGRIYVNCDAGGSNGYRPRLFKLKLQEFANQSGLDVHVSHFPTGTSKWNKIEHRLFCFISRNWRGQPLVSIEHVIDLIGSTTTRKGLKVICVKDDNFYKTGIKVSDEDFNRINIKRDKTCPDWNYVISPVK